MPHSSYMIPLPPLLELSRQIAARVVGALPGNGNCWQGSLCLSFRADIASTARLSLCRWGASSGVKTKLKLKLKEVPGLKFALKLDLGVWRLYSPQWVFSWAGKGEAVGLFHFFKKLNTTHKKGFEKEKGEKERREGQNKRYISWKQLLTVNIMSRDW